MPDYSLGKIYKIVGNGKVYVGSTTRPRLCERIAVHRCSFNRWKNDLSHYLTSFECVSDTKCYIELLETYPCNNKDELRICENKWIQQLDCVNKNNPIKILDKKEYFANYNQEKKDEIREQKKQYYIQNKEQIKERKKKYRIHQSFLKSNLSVETEPQELSLVVEHEQE